MIMSFVYDRVIHFQDTDAAGVVFFANMLTICHEAYEETLRQQGINLKRFFQDPEFALPIVHAEVDFYQPVFCGDGLRVMMQPERLGLDKFKVIYQLDRETTGTEMERVAQGSTVHLCINPKNRQRQALPGWLQFLFE